MESFRAKVRPGALGGTDRMRIRRRDCPELLLGWLALPLLLSACAAPVVLERALGASAVRIYGSTAAFEGREEAIVDTLADALRIASELLATGKVDIGVEFEVYLDGRGAIEGWGVGGYTPDAHRVRLWIDPGASEVPDLLSRRLAWIALHELHHAIRWRGPGYGRTLVEALVSEGLADHFALQCIGEPAPPWTAALSSEQATRLRRSARLWGGIRPRRVVLRKREPSALGRLHARFRARRGPARGASRRQRGLARRCIC